MQDKKNETTDNYEVKLHPVIGIKPGIYLTVLYSVIILLVLFLLFFYPGLKNPSAVLLVKTEPQGAAIRLNGAYMGVSGEKIRITGGMYSIEAVMSGFEAESAVHQIPGRVLFSLFFPKHYQVEFTLKTRDPQAVLAEAAQEFAAWSFMGEPTVAWQIPLVLSESAYRMGYYKNAEAGHILTAASRFAVTRAALRDLSRAKILLDNGGLSPCAGLIGSVSGILSFLSQNTGSAQWLSAVLPPESSSIIRGSAWHSNDNSPEQVIIPVSGDVRRTAISGLSFMEIPAGNLIKNNNTQTINSFLICEEPVPKSLYEVFLNENRVWKDEYINYYDDEIYIPQSEINDADIITGISWHSANAFCLWLTERLPAGMQAKLPMEIEWEYAAMFNISGKEDSALWEWCADPYAPIQFITASAAAVQAVGSPEKSLRGRLSARASLPPDLSSPFVTLRPVITVR